MDRPLSCVAASLALASGGTNTKYQTAYRARLWVLWKELGQAWRCKLPRKPAKVKRCQGYNRDMTIQGVRTLQFTPWDFGKLVRSTLCAKLLLNIRRMTSKGRGLWKRWSSKVRRSWKQVDVLMLKWNTIQQWTPNVSSFSQKTRIGGTVEHRLPCAWQKWNDARTYWWKSGVLGGAWLPQIWIRLYFQGMTSWLRWQKSFSRQIADSQMDADKRSAKPTSNRLLSKMGNDISLRTNNPNSMASR